MYILLTPHSIHSCTPIFLSTFAFESVVCGILILGAIPTSKKDIDLAIKYDISLTMVSVDYLKLLENLIDEGQTLKVHIKLDTGMHRIGLMSKEELSTLLKLVDPDKFNVEGIFTHFATADGDDVAFEKQRSLFYEMIGNCKFKYIHCCNSAAMTYHHDEKSNMGRLGITMYGCSPNGEEETKFKQVMSLYTKVAMIKKIPAGDQVGYGLTYTAKEDEYIAGFIESQQQNLMGMGRVLVRVSGTEPKIRVMVEGEDMEAIQSSAERIADMIRQRIPGVC